MTGTKQLEMDAVTPDKSRQAILVLALAPAHALLTEVMEFLIQENNVMTKMWLMGMDVAVLDRWR